METPPMIVFVLVPVLVISLIHATMAQLRVPYARHILDYAALADIPHHIAMAQVKIESNFKARAIGRLGEVGLLQILPSAVAMVNRLKGTSFSHSDLLDVRNNLYVGFQYLAFLRDKYGSIEQALAAYSAGKLDASASEAYARSVMRASREY